MLNKYKRPKYEQTAIEKNTSLEIENSKEIISGYHPNDTLKYSLPLVNNLAEGFSKGYYENGNLKYNIHYRNGLMNGQAKGFFENENLKYAISYTDNLKHGIEKQFFLNGKLKCVIVYYKGKIISFKKEKYRLRGSD
jgi:antitoxin component YwqK of YwqJK toxin-antitoxin module